MIPSVFDSAQSTSVSPWIVMDGLKWGDLVQGHTPRRYRKGQIIYYQEGMEDCIYLVKQGRINISLINSQGKMRSLYVADKGCLFGENYGYQRVGSITQACANCDAEVYVIPQEEFHHRMEKYPYLMYNLTTTLVRKSQVLIYQIEQLTFYDSFVKVKNVLLALADTYGQVEESGIAIHMRFTHQELASMASVSRVTVANVMSAMQKSGVLSRRKGRAYIRDLTALQNFRMGRL